MKKVLISILIVLLIVLAYFAIFNGLSFGNVKILSVKEVMQANHELTNDIEQAKSLLKKDYPSKKEELSASVTDLLTKKEEYFKLAKVSTDGEITKANTEETYLIEYLWTKIGRHATSKGVNLKMDVNSSDAGEENIKNLAFTVKGQYIGIIEFISSLENDDKLNFKIENFRMIKNEANLTATFTVRNIRIKTEKSSSSTAQATQQTTNSNDDAQADTNTQNDENKSNQLTDNTLAPEENTQQTENTQQ